LIVRNILILFLIGISSSVSYAQDVWLQNYFAPTGGCSLSNGELVNVLINNPSGVVMPSNSVLVSYTIDGASLTQQYLSSNLLPGASWSFIFNVNANLSGCGIHTVKVWVARSGDTNQSNDTLTWSVKNDCPVIPGSAETDHLACDLGNTGTFSLVGWSNGTILDWQTSDDGGANWSGTGQNTTTYTYTNVSQPTRVRAIIDGGFCPDDTSDYATLSITGASTPGIVSGSGSVCTGSNTGSLTISGASDAVDHWEYSTNNGGTWTNIVNTTNSLTYNNLNTTTWYRAYTDGGVCPGVYSNTAIITADNLTNPGLLLSTQTLCKGSSFPLNLGGYLGSIIRWESSPDNTAWTTVTNTTPTYNATNLLDTMYYRVIVKNGNCPRDTSNVIALNIEERPNGGFMAGSDSLCIVDADSGWVHLTNYTGGINFWEVSSDFGLSWTNVPTTNDSMQYFNLAESVWWYRVRLEGNSCPDIYSDTAIIFVNDYTDAGILMQNQDICEDATPVLFLTAFSGSILGWEYSIGGAPWIPIQTSLPFYQENNILDTTSYRVRVKNGICPIDTSNIVTITLHLTPVANAGPDFVITEGDTAIIAGGGAFSDYWSPGESLNDSTLTNPFAFPIVTTTYYYHVTNDIGCPNIDSMTITVIPAPPVQDDTLAFDIKNVITANGDGFNDTWMIDGLEAFPGTFVIVFNTYGNEVFSSPDYQNDWKGTYKGAKLPNGTYFYSVIPGGTESKVNGSITILGDE